MFLLIRVLYRIALITGQRAQFQSYNNSHIANTSYYKDHTEAVREILRDARLTCLDVGARGGAHEVVQHYDSFFSVVMCELDKKEAEQLRSDGHRVIDKGLAGDEGTVTFFECRQPHGSSIKRPLGPYMDFYNADPEYLALYETVHEHTLECTTISGALSELGIPVLDFLKLDTQGSELAILKGMGDYAPLIIVCELQYLPLYHDTPAAYEICHYLYGLGYIPFSLTSFRSEGLCPIEGDGFFMPAWEHPMGKKLIEGREAEYMALMLMFDQGEILSFAARKLQLEIKIPPSGAMQKLSSLARS